jgi:hypothetical protein
MPHDKAWAIPTKAWAIPTNLKIQAVAVEDGPCLGGAFILRVVWSIIRSSRLPTSQPLMSLRIGPSDCRVVLL